MMVERESEFMAALKADMCKPDFEAWGAEVGIVAGDAEDAIKNLDRWTKPQPATTNIVNQPGKSYIMSDPLGVVCIISPWNYPINLPLLPLVGAIAAGNCAVIKPSEISEHTSAAIAKWVPKYLDNDCIQVFEGGVAETTDLLAQKFDHIFYTGNGTVARIVMEAAAKHLTPVTLELGGKSPCILDRNVDLAVAVRRIIWGKFFNAGQTCIAPDYLLVHDDIKDAFFVEAKRVLERFYGTNPQKSDSFARIINKRHFARLKALTNESMDFAAGGVFDEDDLYIAPTIVRDADPNSPIMQEEIFGPLLPTIGYKSTDEAIEFINNRDKPLALYVFSKDQNTIDRILSRTSSGGACVNETLAHAANPNLPFGGVGGSGTGAYHGKHSFDVFSHKKGVLHKGTVGEPPLRYPPYSGIKETLLKKLL